MMGTVRKVSHEIIRSSSLEKFKITFAKVQESYVEEALVCFRD